MHRPAGETTEAAFLSSHSETGAGERLSVGARLDVPKINPYRFDVLADM